MKTKYLLLASVSLTTMLGLTPLASAAPDCDVPGLSAGGNGACPSDVDHTDTPRSERPQPEPDDDDSDDDDDDDGDDDDDDDDGGCKGPKRS